MGPVREQRRARGRRGLAGALVAVCATAAALVPGASARAETSADAQRRADQVMAQVDRLQTQVDAALQAYDGALTGLAASVTRNLNAGEALAQAQRAVDEDRARLADRVRGLYMAGGPVSLYAGVLDATSVQDLFSRVAFAQRVVEVDHTLVDRQARLAALAGVHAAGTARAVQAQVRTERSVAQAADQLGALLAEQQRLLDRARQDVARLKSVEEARARIAAARAMAARLTSERIAALHPLVPTEVYMQLYRAAAPTCPGLSWTVLAAIGQVESGHGRDTSTSYAGAMGPMQFLPSTFAMYGVDGDHDGRIDIMDPADAIYSAASYLCANGAGDPTTLYQAIWNYNHADWYVQMVLSLAQQYAGTDA